MVKSKGVVIAALIANAAIAVLKFGGFLVTGSSAMLSETYHSISDTGNQVFLLLGIWYSGHDPTRQHPFGYGRAQFFYSFLVCVLLFGIAGFESAHEGYAALTQHEAALETGSVMLLNVSFPGIYVNYAVLIGAVFFEGYAFVRSYQSMSATIEDHGWSGFVEAFQKTSDVTVLTALTEDAIALSGLGIALVGLYLTQRTGNPMYDGVAALVIGLLLMGFALALAWENKRLLFGESLPVEEEQPLRDIVTEWDGVSDLVDFRTVYFGPERVIVTADVAFNSDLTTAEIDGRISNLEKALRDANEEVKKVYIEPEVDTSIDR